MRALALLAVLTACNPATTDSKPAEAAAPASPAASADGGTGGLPAGTEASAVVASWEGGTVTYGELSAEVEPKVTQLKIEFLSQRYQTEAQALESMMMSSVLDLEVKAQGVASPEALLATEVEAKVAPPTEDEKRAFYEVVKRQLRGQPYEMVEAQVAGELLRRKQAERFTVYIDELKAKYKVKLQLPYPDLPRIQVSVDDDPSIGPADAPITIVQFAEYQCPYCGKANASIEQVMKEYEGKVRMVYRDFPLSFHDRAIPAAVAANCAGVQGKYWEMHEVLMENQGALSEADLQGYAQGLTLDMSKWESCRQDPAQAAEVRKDMEDGAAAGVSGTPAFFINGIMLSGAQPFSEFKTVIDRELDQG